MRHPQKCSRRTGTGTRERAYRCSQNEIGRLPNHFLSTENNIKRGVVSKKMRQPRVFAFLKRDVPFNSLDLIGYPFDLHQIGCAAFFYRRPGSDDDGFSRLRKALFFRQCSYFA